MLLYHLPHCLYLTLDNDKLGDGHPLFKLVELPAHSKEAVVVFLATRALVVQEMASWIWKDFIVVVFVFTLEGRGGDGVGTNGVFVLS